MLDNELRLASSALCTERNASLVRWAATGDEAEDGGRSIMMNERLPRLNVLFAKDERIKFGVAEVELLPSKLSCLALACELVLNSGRLSPWLKVDD